MKRKIWMGLAALLITACVLLMVAFALGGDEEEVPVQQVELAGTWKVVAYTAANNTSLIDDQYIVFAEGKVAFYRGSVTEPAMTSTYTYEGAQLKMKEAGREYEVDVMSDTVVGLYESPTVCMTLLRCPDGQFDVEICTEEQLEGTWHVIFRKMDGIAQDESFRLENGVLNAYRNGVAEPFLTADYTFENGMLTVPRLNHVMRVFCLDEEHIVFVESETGNPWDLGARK